MQKGTRRIQSRDFGGIVSKIKRDLAPHGLKRLEVAPEDENGEHPIMAEASTYQQLATAGPPGTIEHARLRSLLVVADDQRTGGRGVGIVASADADAVCGARGDLSGRDVDIGGGGSLAGTGRGRRGGLLGMTGGKWRQRQRAGQQQDEVTHGTPGIRSSQRSSMRPGRWPATVAKVLGAPIREYLPASHMAWRGRGTWPSGSDLASMTFDATRIPRRMFRALAKPHAHDSLHCFVAPPARLGCALSRPKNPSHGYR